MAILIEERPTDGYQSPRQYWLVGRDFEVIVCLGKEWYTFFIKDRKGILNSLDFIPRLLKELELYEDPDIEIQPSIDTCGINVVKERHEEIFKLLENYLLMIEKNRYKNNTVR